MLAGLVLVLAAMASAAAPTAPPRPVSAAEIQRALDQMVAGGVPGTIALVRDGNRTMRFASGYGNLAKKTPIRVTDRFRVGSLTKTFVSTVALQLVGEGKLSLDDTVEHWLPGVVPNGENISVHQLLNMTSGLYDYLNEDQTITNRFKAGKLTDRYESLQLVRNATAHKPNFAPGTKYSYCNTCYILIGLIVEKASGRSLGAELKTRIFVPLHLRHTSFDTEPRIAGPHSHGYYRAGKRLVDVSVVSPSSAWAAGGMVSTADDLERFYTALSRGRLLRPELQRAMRTTPGFSFYGLGLARAKTPCGTIWGNSGNFAGYNASVLGSADSHRQYVLFLNLDESSFTPAFKRAADPFPILALCGGRAG